MTRIFYLWLYPFFSFPLFCFFHSMMPNCANSLSLFLTFFPFKWRLYDARRQSTIALFAPAFFSVRFCFLCFYSSLPGCLFKAIHLSAICTESLLFFLFLLLLLLFSLFQPANVYLFLDHRSAQWMSVFSKCHACLRIQALLLLPTAAAFQNTRHSKPTNFQQRHTFDDKWQAGSWAVVVVALAAALKSLPLSTAPLYGCSTLTIDSGTGEREREKEKDRALLLSPRKTMAQLMAITYYGDRRWWLALITSIGVD